MSGHRELSDRLLECMYEVTDRLSFYLCNRKPDHKSGEHLIIPDWASSLERSELAFEARNKLQKGDHRTTKPCLTYLTRGRFE